MIRAHVAAVKALLTFTPQYDAKVPAGAALPYTVIYTNDGTAERDNLAAASTWREWSFQTTAVGSTPDNTRLVAERNQADLLDRVPVVAGRVCGPIALEASRDIERDDDVTPAVFYAVDRWRFTSVPA